jgi:hypothetical protein
MAENSIIYDDDLLANAEADTTTEVGEGFDPDAEYNLPMPPVPDGWHYAKLTNRGVKVNDVQKEFDGPRSWGENVTTYWTMVEATIIDIGGPQNNKKASGNVTTHAEKTQDGRPRGSSANMYYRAITEQPLPGVSQGVHITAVAKELRGEPEVWIKTQLEGQDSDASKDYRERKKAGNLKPGEKAPKTWRGQKAFTDAQGHLTGVKVLEDGTRIVGRPVIVEVKPRSFVPPAK